MRVLKPHLSTVRRPSSLASPAAAIASFAGTQVKICFFLFFSFRSFSDQYYRDSLSHAPGPQTPASPPHNPHPRAFPSSLTSPATAIACIRGHTSKDKFFSSFFCFFSDQCYRDPLYPTRRVLKPPPLHHIIPIPVPRPSSLASPCRCLCLTARKPGRLHLRHMQVRRHCHPITARKLHPRRRLATCKPRRDAIPTRHARPATTLTRHAQAPPWRHPNTERKAPPPPTSRDANMARRTPPPRRNANTSHRTPPPRHPQHGMQNGAAVGTVAVVDSGMVAVGMAATARHSYLLLRYRERNA